ncbi:MAG: Glu-tRNA(Gln) amidotransferase GatDE subunit E, partial [Thermoplasmata archaeon]
RLEREFKVHRQQVEQLVDEGWDDLFEELAKRFGRPAAVARTFLNHLPELRGEGVEIDHISKTVFVDLFAALESGRFAKEAIPLVLKEAIRRGAAVGEVLEGLDLGRLTEEELEEALDAILEENMELLVERREGATKALMGIAMAKLRGRADGKLINETLRRRVEKRLRKL